MVNQAKRIANQQEEARLACLHRLLVLDAPPDNRLDTIVQTAQRAFGVQAALISLVDRNRQWFLARSGFDLTETSRELSFCNATIRTSLPVVIGDTHEDEHYADHPLVTGAPFIRFYAGVALIAEQRHRIGTICLVDPHPRDFPDSQISQLVGLARLSMLEISRFANQRKLAERLEQLEVA